MTTPPIQSDPIELRMLAGVIPHSVGLPRSLEQLQKIDAQRASEVNTIQTHCKVHAVVLALLVLITAASAATLIVTNVGTQNLPFLFLGSAVGTLSVGLLVWFVIVVAKACQQQRAAEKKAHQLSSQRFSFEEVLNLMREEKVDARHIRGALNTFSAEQRQSFIMYVYNQSSLVDDNILIALTSFPADLPLLQDQEVKREFVVAILRNMSSYVARSEEGSAIVLKYMALLGSPQSDKEAQGFAEHPKVFAQFVLSDQCSLIQSDFASIFRQMSQKHLLDYMRLTGKKTIDSNSLADQSLKVFIRETLTPEFARTFQTHNTQRVQALRQAKELTAEEQKLLRNFDFKEKLLRVMLTDACLPHLLDQIYLHAKSRLFMEVDFMEKLYGMMTEGQQANFNQLATKSLRDSVDAKTFIVDSLQAYGEKPLIKPTLQRCAHLPIGVAQAPLDALPRENVHAIIEAMDVEKRLVFLLEEKNLSPTRMQTRVDQILSNFSSITPNWKETLIRYFNAYPDDIISRVLENSVISSEEMRRKIACQLFEEMSSEAVGSVLGKLDAHSASDTRFFELYSNYLFELRGQEIDHITESQGKLLARFRFAQINIVESNSSVSGRIVGALQQGFSAVIGQEIAKRAEEAKEFTRLKEMFAADWDKLEHIANQYKA